MVELDNNYTGTDSGKIYSCDDSHCTQLISKGFFETSYIYSCDEDGTCTKAQSMFILYNYFNIFFFIDLYNKTFSRIN